MSKRKFIENILTLITVIVLAVLVYALDYNDTKIEQTKETRLNTIESRLNEQMNYIHQLEADVDNLYRIIE